MNWKLKSSIQRACGQLPFGGAVYSLLQRCAGGLRHPDYMDRFREQQRMARAIAGHGVEIAGARVMEIGTGWIPLAPVGFWICGARSVATYDIRRHLSMDMLHRALLWIVRNSDELSELWKDVAPEESLADKFRMVELFANRPEEFLERAGIEYVAPGDAARTGLEDGSIDIQYSTTVLEHIGPEELAEILREAGRMLRQGGISAHVVDPTDHFSHADAEISRINFLRFEDSEWSKYNDNVFAYQNRLRDSQYRSIFANSPLDMVECRSEIDEESRNVIAQGFPLAGQFRQLDVDDLCRYRLIYIARNAATE